ncbi:MAG: hypothetical protein AAB225_29280 [Acidobacteriota bacterium]
MSSQARAILRVQCRSLWNFRTSEGVAGRLLAGALALLWYSLWAGLAVTAASLLDQPARAELLVILPWGLMSVFLYWQLAPVLAASLGATLDLKKLLVYPIPEGQLFAVEVLLRLTTGLEMVLVLIGSAIGLLRNPIVPRWAPLVALPLFALFNLLLAAGLRNLLERVLARKHVRETVVLLLVLAAGLPQLMVLTGPPLFLRQMAARKPLPFWPWVSFGKLAAGEAAFYDWGLIALWLAAAYLFGRWQFRSSLRFDRAAVEASATRPARTAAATERFFRLPSWLAPDPLAALIEKELRSLFRSPRFRLVFLMGFSFGFLIWWPVLRRPGQGLSGDYPVFVSLYALLLLSEVVFWNVFGFDRSAVQVYLTAPVSFSRVLIGKNLAAASLVTLEVTVVLLVCAVLRIPLAPLKILEVYAVTLILCVYMLAAGNLSSLYYPRAVNPEHSWGRASSARFQFLALLLYPVLGSPVLLAYAARFAFESQAAFFGMLGVAAGIGAAFYWVALDSALALAEQRKERLIEALGRGAGPVLTQ